MIIKIENHEVVAAIIDCLNLPINRKCDGAIVRDNEIIFLYDCYEYNTAFCRFPIWSNMEVKYWGPVFSVMPPYSIGHYEIDLKTGKSRWICCYNREGRIKYGRYYEPSMD